MTGLFFILKPRTRGYSSGGLPMKILVTVKRVMDYKANIRLKADGSGVDTAHVKMIMNPFDEIAVEEALRIKEKNMAQEVVVMSIGTEACQETLRSALAMGADRAIWVKTNDNIQPLVAAQLIHAIVEQEKSQLVLLGKQAIDTDDNQTGQMLAGLLNWPQGTFASKLEFHDNKVSVTREIDGGLETLLLQLPAVVTTDLRLNEPRYTSLPNIIQAKKKPLQVIDASILSVDLQSRQTLLQVAIPKKERKHIRINSVDELLHQLREAQVI